MFRREPEPPKDTPLRRRTYWASVNFRLLLFVELFTEFDFSVELCSNRTANHTKLAKPALGWNQHFKIHRCNAVSDCTVNDGIWLKEELCLGVAADTKKPALVIIQ